MGRRAALVATWRAASRLKITAAFMRATACLVGILVGEVPSTLPNQAMAYKWALPRPWTVCAYGGDGGGGGRGNIRVAKTPPLQSAMRSALRLMPPIAIVSMPHTMPHMETYGFYYDAARRIVIKTVDSYRWEA